MVKKLNIQNLKKLRDVCRRLSPYLKWTISGESPGYHPTMPSIVNDFLANIEDFDNLIIEVDKLENQVKQLQTEINNIRAINKSYMDMLGPIASEVVDEWNKKGIDSIYFDWGEGAKQLSGEERAQAILDFIKAPSKLIEDFDENIDRTLYTYEEFVEILDKEK